MNTVSSIIDYVASILNDNHAGFEHEVWPEPVLLASLNEAFAKIAQHIPWLFKVSGELTLSPGASQVIPPEMQDGFNVVGQQCVRNNVPYVRSGITHVEDAGGDMGCCPQPRGMFTRAPDPNDPCSAYSADMWSTVTGDMSSFNISPPVPFGTAPVLRVTYVKAPVFTTGEALGAHTRHVALVVDWMLFRAYSVDLKTDEVRLRADTHLKAFEGGIDAIIKLYGAMGGRQ